MALLILGIFLFLATHLIRVVTPGLRLSMIDRFGMTGWRVINSVFSLVSLVLLIWGFATAPFVDVWYPPVGMTHLTLTLMLIAMVCLAAGFLPAGHIAAKTKHPIVLAIKIWALAHLLANGDLASVLLFGSILAYGVVLRINYKRRERAGEVVPRAFVSAKWDLAALVLGIAFWALITFWLHEVLIGVAPLVM